MEESLPALFLNQASRRPHSLAICTPKQVWSYRTLDSVSLALANCLLAKFPCYRERAALVLGHDVWMIAGIFGTLRAGMTYVPIDPAWPLSRVNYILEDCSPRVIITDEIHLDYASRMRPKRPLICADADSAGDAEYADRVLPRIELKAVQADSLAYLLYTSGSTGAPKGVMQSHRNVLAHIRNYSKALRITYLDRLSLFSTYAFDAAVMDIFGALLNGAALYPLNPRMGNLHEIACWIQKNALTIYHSTPTLYRQFLSTTNRSDNYETLRFVVLGGEKALKTDFELYKQYFPRTTRLVNGYGPTECTIGMQNFMNHNTRVVGPTVPLGRAVNGVRVSVLNKQGQKKRFGLGQIALTSHHVALGYWGKPDLTQKAFYFRSDGLGTYLTGDFARRVAAGRIEYVGRSDRRLKVSGYSIEPAEIEDKLLHYPGVLNAAVAFRQTGTRGELTAYFVSKPGWSVATVELHRFLLRSLPKYMVPSAFVELRALPLTPTGKLDPKGLNRVVPSRNARRCGVPGPHAVEELVRSVWADALGRTTMSRNDNFFRLGGDSLAAVNVVFRIADALGIEMPTYSLFDHPTLGDFVLAIRAAETTGRGQSRQARIAEAKPNSISLSFAQLRYWARLRESASSAQFHIAILYRLHRRVKITILKRCLEQIIQRHEALRMTFSETRRTVRQFLHAKPELPFRAVDLRLSHCGRRISRIDRLYKAQAALPLDLTNEPPIRFVLYRLSAHGYTLLSVQHHLITDGWSRGIFEDELGSLYDALLNHKPSPLPAVPYQYSDFVVSERLRRSRSHVKQMAFWRATLENGGFEVAKLPWDHPSSNSVSSAAASLSGQIASDDFQSLKLFSAQEAVTTFTTMLAVFNVLLFSYSSQRDIVITTDTSGRCEPKWSRVYGLFTNVLILRSRLTEAMRFRKFLHQIHGIATQAYLNQEVCFSEIMETICPGRLHAYDLLFPVGFFWESRDEAKQPRGSVIVQSSEINIGEISRDLMLVITELKSTLDLSLLYRTERFNRSTIAFMLARLLALLRTVIRAPDVLISELVEIVPIAGDVHQPPKDDSVKLGRAFAR